VERQIHSYKPPQNPRRHHRPRAGGAPDSQLQAPAKPTAPPPAPCRWSERFTATSPRRNHSATTGPVPVERMIHSYKPPQNPQRPHRPCAGGAKDSLLQAPAEPPAPPPALRRWSERFTATSPRRTPSATTGPAPVERMIHSYKPPQTPQRHHRPRAGGANDSQLQAPAEPPAPPPALRRWSERFTATSLAQLSILPCKFQTNCKLRTNKKTSPTARCRWGGMIDHKPHDLRYICSASRIARVMIGRVLGDASSSTTSSSSSMPI